MGRQLAVKEIPIKKGKTFETREVSLLKKLRHERIVLFYGTDTKEVTDPRGKTTTYLHIFMEYMPGESIHNYLETHGALEEALARKFTVQLLEGVAYLHHKNVVHRDIKGANILRDSHGNIKLVDFGCSKELMAMSIDGKQSYNAGTAHWRAPESLDGDHVFESDIWSVGATVVEMLTANPPFSDLQPETVILEVGNRRLTPTISQSREARVFLQKCFKREHSQ